MLALPSRLERPMKSPLTQQVGPSDELSGRKELSKSSANTSSAVDFADVLSEAVDSVRGAFAEARDATTDALVGQGTPHRAMLAMSKADLTFRFLTQARNKVVDAYREMMNLQL